MIICHFRISTVKGRIVDFSQEEPTGNYFFRVRGVGKTYHFLNKN
jgi:hypothetical protein